MVKDLYLCKITTQILFLKQERMNVCVSEYEREREREKAKRKETDDDDDDDDSMI